MTIRYVSPTGSGTTCSSGSPCTISQAVSVTTAGDEIHAQDGVYQGATQMLAATGINGTSGSRILFKAINDGEVRIDGQDTRCPAELSNSSYWDIEGINFCNSAGQDACFRLSNGASNNRIKRCIAWDAGPLSGNVSVWFIYNNSCGNLLEDVAGFGTGRKIFGQISNACQSNPNIWRRPWGQWEDNSDTAPKITAEGIYDSRGTTFENGIFTWAQRNSRSNAYGMGLHSGTINQSDRSADLFLYGCITYLESGKSFAPAQFFFETNNDEVHINDTIVYVPSDQSSKQAVVLGACKVYPALTVDCTTHNKSLFGVTLIGGSGNTINAHYTQTNVHEASTLAGVYTGGDSLYVNNGSKGATICYKYENGNITANPLWPWPMNQRIIDAMADAGETPVDVTATIEAIFGTIPSECRWDGSWSPAAFSGQGTATPSSIGE